MLRNSKKLLAVCLGIILVSAQPLAVVQALNEPIAKDMRNGIKYFNRKDCPLASVDCTCGAEQGGAGNGPIVNLKGSSNEEKTWNFFIDKGLTPEQTAGIMSNIEQESHFNPQVMEINGKNSKDPYDAKDKGWGIIQWSGNAGTGRSTGDKFIGLYKQAGLTSAVYKLGTQLELTWAHMNGKPHITTGKFSLEHFKTIKSSLESAEYFGEHIEGFGKAGGRFVNTDKWLTKYGSGGGGGTANPSDPDESSPCDDPGPGGGGGGEKFTGSAQDAAKELLSNANIRISDDRDMVQAMADGKESPLDPELIKMLAALAKNHTYTISSLYRGPCSGSKHCVGKASDISAIDGQTISYEGHNPKIQKFIDDAAKIRGGDCENGVPNQEYVNKTKANGSKCEVFVDKGTGPHVHLAVQA